LACESRLVYTKEPERAGQEREGDLMAFLEKTLGGIVVGFAAGMVGQSYLSSAGSAAGSTMRPMVKALIAGGVAAADQVRAVASEVVEQVTDLVAEVQSERAPDRGAASQGKRKHAD
jgi:hypothetical protein